MRGKERNRISKPDGLLQVKDERHSTSCRKNARISKYDGVRGKGKGITSSEGRRERMLKRRVKPAEDLKNQLT